MVMSMRSYSFLDNLIVIMHCCHSLSRFNAGWLEGAIVQEKIVPVSIYEYSFYIFRISSYEEIALLI